MKTDKCSNKSKNTKILQIKIHTKFNNNNNYKKKKLKQKNKKQKNKKKNIYKKIKKYRIQSAKNTLTQIRNVKNIQNIKGLDRLKTLYRKN